MNWNFQALSFAVAALGAVLGVINLCWQLFQSRIKLKLNPYLAVKVGTGWRLMAVNLLGKFPEYEKGERVICIEVINLSLFTVFISEVGLCDSLLNNSKGNKSSISAITPSNPSPWPRELRSRENLRIFLDVPDGGYSPDVLTRKKMFAKTACAHVTYKKFPQVLRLFFLSGKGGKSSGS